MKKFFTYPVFVVLFLSFIGMMGFGAILKYNLEGGEKYQFLQKPIIFISSFPENLKKILEHGSLDLNSLPKLKKHKKKNEINFYKNSSRNALLVLPRYLHDLQRPVVDIIDLNNFKIIHTYKHDIQQMNNLVKNKKKFPTIQIDNQPKRFEYWHSLILNDGSLIADGGTNSPLFKINFCSNLVWINDQEIFHHSKMFDHKDNIWVGGRNLYDKSSYSEVVSKYKLPNKFIEDTIINITEDGEIIKKISVLKLLIQNSILPKNFVQNAYYKHRDLDPTHLNDIEPALQDTKYWLKGDVFLSLRGLSSIIHYRPETNEVVNYITGPFSMQHDVDIISDSKLSIFNNNNYRSDNDHSEIIIYDFKTKQFQKYMDIQLKKNNFKTKLQGLSYIFKDGSLLVEEQESGRIILFDSKGEKEWEFINKDKNGDIGNINWSRVIEDELFIEKFKLMVKNKKCLD